MVPSSVIDLGQHQDQGILEGLGGGDSPSLGEMSVAVCHGCLSSQLLRQLSSAGYADPTLQESLPPLPLVKNSGGFHSSDLGFRAWPLVVYFIQSSPASLLPRPLLEHGSPLL